MGVGAMTDFGPLIANPKSFLPGSCSVRYLRSYFIYLHGFNDKAAAAISINAGGRRPDLYLLVGKLVRQV